MNDFCDAAIRATRSELRIMTADALRQSARSGVVDLPERDRSALGPTRAAVIGVIVIAMAALLFGVAAKLGFVPAITAGRPRSIALGCAVIVAVAFVMASPAIEKRTARKIAATRPVTRGFESPEVVGVEPAATYKRLKILPDDIAMLSHDRANRRLLLEGSGHCYLICGSDVRSHALGSVGVGSGVQLVVAIGSVELDLVISAREKMAEPVSAEGRQTNDQRERFRQRLLATLATRPVA